MTLLEMPHVRPFLLEERSGWVGRTLCNYGWHDYSRWERVSATLQDGRKVRNITVQIRECIRPSCGFSETKYL